MNRINLTSIIKPGITALLLMCLGITANVAQAAIINKTVCVRGIQLFSVPFWGFTENCTGMGSGLVPGPVVEVGVGDTLNLTLNMMMAPQEPAPYSGHTIHMHGADVKTSEDGIPETGGVTTGDTYTWTPAAGMEGSYAYHCHQHTVKHLEMGMYATLVVRPKNASGAFLNQINSNSATAFDYVQNYMLSTVDPNYHTAIGDSTVFADYNPTIFLIDGKQGTSTSSPAITLAAVPSKKVALRLIGMHSVNGTFSLGGPSFTVYVRDGRTLSSPMTVSSIDITPGTRYDILFTLPSASGTMYPQMTYKKLRDNATYATVYGRITY